MIYDLNHMIWSKLTENDLNCILNFLLKIINSFFWWILQFTVYILWILQFSILILWIVIPTMHQNPYYTRTCIVCMHVCMYVQSVTILQTITSKINFFFYFNYVLNFLMPFITPTVSSEFSKQWQKVLIYYGLIQGKN